MGSVRVDCDACAVRGPACGSCVVTVLLGAPPLGVDVPVETDDDVDAAIAVLVRAGAVHPAHVPAHLAPPRRRRGLPVVPVSPAERPVRRAAGA